MALTSKQKAEVNKSIMGYFKSSGWDDLAAVFADENPEAEYKDADEKKYKSTLQRKWRSIIRLNKTIARLTEENEQLQDELDSIKDGTKVNTSEALPKKLAYLMEGHREQVRCVKFFPTASKPYLASCSEDCDVIIWDFTTGRIKKMLKGHKNPVEWVAFSPDGSYLASCGEDCKVILWDTTTLKQAGKTITAHDHTVSCLVWDHSGDNFYTVGRDKAIKKWNLETRRQLKEYNTDEEGHDQWIKQIIVSPDGKHLATCGLDQVITTWNEASGEVLWQLRDHENAIESIAYSCSAACDNNIIEHCLDIEEDKKLARSKKSELKEDKGGMFLASASRDKKIMIWFLVNGVCVKVIKGHDTWVRSVLFHPSGRFLLSASDDKSIRVWDIKKNFKLQQHMIDAHESFILCMDWHKSLASLVTGGQEKEIKVWQCK